jgi:hypothetical protein
MTGRDPVDRGTAGSKNHVVADRHGVPLSVAVSAANTHDSQALTPLVMAIPAIRSRRGRRRRKTDKLHADKAYDGRELRGWVRDCGIGVRIARTGVESSDRPGRHRWVIERTMCLDIQLPPIRHSTRAARRQFPRISHPGRGAHLLLKTPYVRQPLNQSIWRGLNPQGGPDHDLTCENYRTDRSRRYSWMRLSAAQSYCHTFTSQFPLIVLPRRVHVDRCGRRTPVPDSSDQSCHRRQECCGHDISPIDMA